MSHTHTQEHDAQCTVVCERKPLCGRCRPLRERATSKITCDAARSLRPDRDRARRRPMSDVHDVRSVVHRRRQRRRRRRDRPNIVPIRALNIVQMLFFLLLVWLCVCVVFGAEFMPDTIAPLWGPKRFRRFYEWSETNPLHAAPGAGAAAAARPHSATDSNGITEHYAPTYSVRVDRVNRTSHRRPSRHHRDDKYKHIWDYGLL